MMKDIYLIGAGGHSVSCVDVIEAEGKYRIRGFFDSIERKGQKVLGNTIIGSDEDIGKYVGPETFFLITVGQIKTPEVRMKIYKNLKDLGARMATVISPRAYVSKYATIGEGTIVLHDALVNANVEVGVNCIVNTKSLIEHDSIVAGHSHISTAVVINGGCRIGEGSFVGSNSVLKEGSIIPERAILRAGEFHR